jgi:hypothetical protein
MHRLLSGLLAALLPLAASAQQPETTKIRLRAVLHDPLKPYAEMYFQGVAGGMERLNLAVEGLTEAQTVAVQKGTLRLFSSAKIDPAKPLANLAATVTVPAEIKRAIVFILPAAADAKQPYQLMVLNDSFAAFAKGESRVINMTRLPLAVKAGEHAVEVPAGKITKIPPVTKVNDLNQAQTTFYRKLETEWSLLSERPTQYTPEVRNIFLMFVMPNVEEPQIRTIIDTTTTP